MGKTVFKARSPWCEYLKRRQPGREGSQGGAACPSPDGTEREPRPEPAGAPGPTDLVAATYYVSCCCILCRPMRPPPPGSPQGTREGAEAGMLPRVAWRALAVLVETDESTERVPTRDGLWPGAVVEAMNDQERKGVKRNVRTWLTS
jgi:hypothetical protein